METSRVDKYGLDVRFKPNNSNSCTVFFFLFFVFFFTYILSLTSGKDDFYSCFFLAGCMSAGRATKEFGLATSR
jgi:hypothetical protein